MNYLLISPKMFDYHKDMISFLLSKGNKVTWFYDSIDATLCDKTKNSINKKYLANKFNDYWNGIIRGTINEKFDKIVVIFGDKYLNDECIKKLLFSHKEAKSVYYAWDSVANYPNILTYYKLFDRSISFDKIDCDRYGMEFRPLFYSISSSENTVEYDYCSIMTYGWQKSNNYQKIKSSLPSGLKAKEYLYVRSKKSLFFNKVLHSHSYNWIDKRAFKFEPLTKAESINLMNKSKVVIDAPLDNQNGLTIRTFEALALKRKLITTNKNIKTYDFYSPDNIFVVEKNKKIDRSFFEKKFDDDFALGDYYSFEAFMRDVFEMG